jgi:hypothetical protein
MLKRIVVLAMAVVLPVVVLIGCGGPPKEDIEKATKAKAAADAAKADVYSKDSYDAAMAAWKEGTDLDKKSDFGKSKVKYQEAAKKFDEAAKAAPDNMKKAQDDATAMVATLKAAKEAYGKDKKAMMAAKGMKKDDKAKYDAAMKEFDAMLAEGEGMIADNAMGAMEKLNGAKAKWDEAMAMTMPKKK